MKLSSLALPCALFLTGCGSDALTDPGGGGPYSNAGAGGSPRAGGAAGLGVVNGSGQSGAGGSGSFDASTATDGSDLVGSSEGGPEDAGATDREALKTQFADWRFGMFIHFGMNTFSNDNGKDLPNQDPALFNPSQLNPGQWMDAAKAAGMRFAVLTTKHHDGFLLWDSATTDYDVGNVAVPPAGHKDVVKLYVDAARARGIAPGLYYSIQDRSKAGLSGGGDANPFASGWHATNARMPRELIDFVKAQIKELLTGYGFIPFFVTDGWAWSMGHTIMPYQEIREYIHELSPNTLYSEHQGLLYPWHDDLVYFEEPKGGAFAPQGNVLASWQGLTSGHAWFWTPPDAGYSKLNVTKIVADHLQVLEPRYCNFTPNFGPNRQGLLEQAQVDVLTAVGKVWAPNAARPQLPAQPTHLDHVLTAIAATAQSTATGSNARNAIDGVSDGGFTDHYTQTVWQSAAAAPQWLTVDLGAAYGNIEMLSYLPVQIAPQQASSDTSGEVTGYQISTSMDGTTFTPVVLRAPSNGTWAGDTTWKVALFSPAVARFVRLNATSATGNNVKISEIDVGGHLLIPR